uniref:Transposase, MuDR, MULE transposase domain protein n=1 Tax=Tanacetum cinerariifolium TaxID=118510 RepID=A0A6L2L8H7_TANCI|nr:transposase, MuDR, MULE transposase domain protein [Tanacetum cinerariifolium]
MTLSIAWKIPSKPLLNTHPSIPMKQEKDPETHLVVGRGFLATVNAVIDCRMAKIAIGEGITRSVLGVKGVELGEEEAPYWTTHGKRELYKPRPSSDGVGAQTSYYSRKDFLDCHLPSEWEIFRDDELNPFKDKPPKDRDGAWHAKTRLVDPDGEEFTKTLQSIPTTRKLSKRENPREIIELDHFYDACQIRTFVNYLRLLLVIDATHLNGQYKETNLVAVGMDENNQIVSIDFGICKGETGLCWSWWMSVLKESIGDSPNLLFISDGHAAIALALHNEFPLAFYAICCHHLIMNLSLKRKKTKGLFWKICKAYTQEEFSTKMHNLQDVQPDAYHKLCEASLERWSRAHYPLVRYNYMTSNSVESVNAYIVLYRKLPMLKLAEMYRAMVQEWYFKCQELAGMKSIKNDFDTNVMYNIAKVAGKLQLFVSYYQIDLSTVLIPNDGSLEESFVANYNLEIFIDQLGVDFIIAKYIFSNASLAELMNHVITNYTSESEDDKREVTQNDYTFNQIVEWAEQEHFEDEGTKEVQRQHLRIMIKPGGGMMCQGVWKEIQTKGVIGNSIHFDALGDMQEYVKMLASIVTQKTMKLERILDLLNHVILQSKFRFLNSNRGNRSTLTIQRWLA